MIYVLHLMKESIYSKCCQGPENSSECVQSCLMRMSPVVLWSPASLNTGNRGGWLYPGSPVTLPPPGCPVTLRPSVVCIMLMLHRHAALTAHCSINGDQCDLFLHSGKQLDTALSNLRGKSWDSCWELVYRYFCIGIDIIILYVAVSYSGFNFNVTCKRNDCFQHCIFTA